MKVLIIKMSSMGDILHTLPALTDAQRQFPDIEFDWVVEENFKEIPQWHPAVKKVIPVALRRWRKNIFKALFSGELRNFFRQLRTTQYDYVIDAQGLFKSAMITRFTHGPRYGLDKQSLREPCARFAYQHMISVAKNQHAINRTRQLFSQVLNYPLDASTVVYGIDTQAITRPTVALPERYCVFIPNTSWPTKHWPVDYWRSLIGLMHTQHRSIVIPSGYAHELSMIQTISAGLGNVSILPPMSLQELSRVIARSDAVVSVDTGLAHLSAALAKPTITLYGPTDPAKIGTLGAQQIHLQAKFPCAPCGAKKCSYTESSAVKPACYTTVTPAQVWQALQTVLQP
jgi:heptosyltransferase-1